MNPKPSHILHGAWQRVMHPDETRLEESRQWWSKQYGRELTLAKAAEIHKNLFGLVKLLVEIDARQEAIKTGQAVVDEEKVARLRGDIYRLEDQIRTMGKLIGRWSKGQPQRLALENARASLEQQAAVKRRALEEEVLRPVRQKETPPPIKAPFR
ncbi:MAG: hypothetical protein HY927_06130 [Elusimicrobia bacterium]|nr:hypothetical protein [Elusimicrobiota bacterium]